MDSKKEPEKKNNSYISPYRYLADSLKEMRKIILPTTEQTKASYSAFANSVERISDSVTKIYFNRNLSEDIRVIANEMSQTLKTYLDNSIGMSQDALESMIELLSDIQREQIETIRKIDFSEIFTSMYKSLEDGSLKNLRDVVEATYKAVQEYEEDDLDADDVLSAEEVKEAIEEQINNPKGFQQRVKEWSEKKIVKFFIIWRLICFLYSNFFQPYFQQNVGLPVMTWAVSNVKELPQKEAEVICQIKEGVEAVIIENTNYYYKVSFTDENGVKQEGYVAKRNLKLIHDDDVDIEKDTEIEDNSVEISE